MNELLDEIDKDFNRQFCYHDFGALKLDPDILHRRSELKDFLRSACIKYAKAVAEEVIGEDDKLEDFPDLGLPTSFRQAGVDLVNNTKSDQRQKLTEILEEK